MKVQATEPIDEFLLPPRGKSEPKDFDLLAHLEIKEAKEGEEEAAEDEEPDPDAEVQVVQQGFRGGGGGCRGGADVQSCRVAELQRCRVAEVQSCRNAGADMIEKCRRGAEEYKCRCRVSAK